MIYINEYSISRATTLPKGLHWNKEETREEINAKRVIFLPNEQPKEDKNGMKESLPRFRTR